MIIIDLTYLEKKLYAKKSELTRREAEKQILDEQKNEKENEVKTISKDIYQTILAKELLEHASKSSREHGKSLLESAVTEIVKIVFGDLYEVNIELGEKAGNPIADVYVKKQIGLNNDFINLSNEGGGLTDVISLAFFVAISRLAGRENGTFILMDEPTSAVSKGRAESVAEAISLLTAYLEKTSIIITHEREFLPNLIDHIYYVEQGVDGISKVEAL